MNLGSKPTIMSALKLVLSNHLITKETPVLKSNGSSRT